MATARSNPFDDIEGLLEALAAAPQDKEGAFRVSTWKMVIAELVAMKEAIGETAQVAASAEAAAKERPSIDEIKEAVAGDLKQEIDASDAETILF